MALAEPATCSKVSFLSYAEAFRRLVEIALCERTRPLDGDDRKPSDAYFCYRCDAWHLTRIPA